MLPPVPGPNKVMEWSMEFWRRVLLGTEQVQSSVAEMTRRADDKDQAEQGKPPQIW